MLDKMVYETGRAAIDLYTRLMLDMDVVSHAPVPDGPKIYAANHPTTTDPFFLMAYIPERISILITEMAFNVPGFGAILNGSGHVPVVHENGRVAFDAAVELLKSGRSVGIFPEGALSPREGGLCRPRTGAARLALTAGVPVVPMGIHLVRDHIQYIDMEVGEDAETARWYLRGPYTVTIGKAMMFGGSVEDWEFVRGVSDQIINRIGQLTRESARRLMTAHLPQTSTDTGQFARIYSPEHA